MLITNRLEDSPSGGREMLCRLNHAALRDLFGDRLTVVELEKAPVRDVRAALAAFRGHIDGVSTAAIDAVLGKIDALDIGQLFVDGSNLGEVTAAVKRRAPRVRVYTFFHNVESLFFWGSFKQARTVHALAVAAVNYLAERQSVRHSDELICLSERDSRMLQRLYGRAATYVSPMALRDRLPETGVRTPDRPDQVFALFVGGVFYANLAGIAWFVDQVAPRIDIQVRIVGKGFEAHKAELERAGKVKVVGAVEDLAGWYADASFVIAPIFDGSGMKTKVAEALMFGKKVIGTPEAFSGYEDVAERAGTICATAEEFVDAIEQAAAMPLKPFDPELRSIYEEKYSYLAARKRLAAILGMKEPGHA